LPKVDAGVHVIQLNEMPPDHLDLDKIKGNERYRLLAESDWLFEFDVPGNDYGQIASPKEELLQSLLRNPAIDLNDLPLMVLSTRRRTTASSGARESVFAVIPRLRRAPADAWRSAASR
jgi:hypothetical protein